jgi:transposase
MEEERIALSQRDRDRLRVLHQVSQRDLKQVEAANRLGLSTRQVRRLLGRIRRQGDRGLIHKLRGRRSNRRISSEIERRALELVKGRYGDFGPTLASEHLVEQGIGVSRETLRKWMIREQLWRPRRRRVKAVHVWRERRASFGELVMMDSSPFRWFEERAPQLQMIAMIDDATSRIWARFAEHDSTEENMRTLGGWLHRHGRPLALYTDRNSLFRPTRPPSLDEQLSGTPALSQIGRALRELDVRWIAAHSPQGKGRIERLFETLQHRLVKELRLADRAVGLVPDNPVPVTHRVAPVLQAAPYDVAAAFSKPTDGARVIRTVEDGNRYLEQVFIPFWEARFAVAPRRAQDAHRPLGRDHRLESILSIRDRRTVALDYTVSWQGNRWGVARADVRPGLRRARVEVERRLDGSVWLRYRHAFVALGPCEVARPLNPSHARDRFLLPIILGGGRFHLARKRTFLLCVDTTPCPPGPRRVRPSGPCLPHIPM